MISITLGLTLKTLFAKKPKEAIVNDNTGKFKRFVSKLSGAFMLPVSVMAIAGLFLGIGSIINTNTVIVDAAGISTQTAASTFGLFLKALGEPVFASMPALFMVAVIISFTDDIATAVFAGLIAFLVFNAMQQPFIMTHEATKATQATYQKDASGAFVLLKDAMPATRSWATVLIPIDNAAIKEKMFNVVGKNFGFTSINASIFTGIVIGFIVSWTYKKFHQVELPTAVAFFGGKRFVALVAILLMIPCAFLFMLLWPWIGIGLAYFGEYSGRVFGVDALVVGYVERALIPFGLQHVFYAPLWWSGAGGDANQLITDWLASNNRTFAAATNLGADMAATNTIAAVGDNYIWMRVNSLPYNMVRWTETVEGITSEHSLPVFDFFAKQLGLNLGRFMQYKFGFYQTGLPMAALAMIMAAPKPNRKLAASVVIPAAATGFVTGVTEPIEFTFVFLSPALYWGFHSLMSGINGLLMVIAGVHMGTAFSGGVIEEILYGVVPFQKGTNFWWALVIAAGNAPIYYFFFYFWIKRFNIPTPGRGENVKLYTKADYAARNAEAKNQIDDKTMAIVAALGGWENLVSLDNCATRLRYDVKDADIIDKKALLAAGAMGYVRVSKTHVQVIFGPKADSINNAIKAAKADRGKNAPTKAGK